MEALMRRCGLACALALFVAVPAPAEASRSGSVKGNSIVRELRAGRAVVREGVTVDGPLDLTGMEVVRRVFKCQKCTFRGLVSAPDVTFDRTIDLSGSTLKREANFRGATFNGPALFRAAFVESNDEPHPVLFRRRADFSLAVFNDLASFGGSEFLAAASFRDTRFADATFASTIFRTADFNRASFRGAANFNGAEFKRAAGFEEVDLRDRTDFSLAVFRRGGVFTNARFVEGASFLAAEFYASPAAEEAARFDTVASAGNLDFTFAVFDSASKKPRVIAVFSDLVCGRSLVFRDTTFTKRHQIAMNRLQVSDLILDVDVVPQINDEEDRRTVLQSIEESAKARGDLAEANDAHYALRVLRSKDYGPVGRSLDYAFYRGLAGYFVRPFRPLFVLVLLATFLSLLRVIRSRGEAASQGLGTTSRPRRLWRGAKRSCGDFLRCLLDTFALAVPRWGGQNAAALSLGQRLEVITYRLLFVCALLGLANSNPTLRDMVDTLF